MTLLPRIGWDTKLGALNAFYGIERGLNNRDRVITPSESISKVIRESSAGGVDADGVRIYLAPGRYFIQNTINISRNKIHLIAAVPGQSVIVYDCTILNSHFSARDTPTPAFNMFGDECSLRGLRFVESVTATQLNAASLRFDGDSGVVNITGHGCAIDDCHFGDSTARDSVIQINSANFTRITNNTIDSFKTHGVEIKGDSTTGAVHMNFLRQSRSVDHAIHAEDSVSRFSFVGNIVSPISSSSDSSLSRTVSSVGTAGNAISYKTGLQNADAGNVGTVTVR